MNKELDSKDKKFGKRKLQSKKMEKLKHVLLYYWPITKKYKWAMLIVFFGYGGGIVLASTIQPLLYRSLIDTISSSERNAEVASILFHLFLAIGSMVVIYNVIFRIADYHIVRSQSKIIRDLYNFSFANLNRHSYSFFTNNFSGALVTKTKRFVQAFASLFDNLVFSFWMTAVRLLGVFIVLFIIEPRVGLFFLGWCVLFIGVILVFVKKRIPYDLATAAQDSKVTARHADVITNTLNIKMFAAAKREYSSFMNVTEQEQETRLKAWKFQNLQWTVQGILVGVLEVGGLYLAINFWLEGIISTGTLVLIQIYFAAIFVGIWDLGRAMSRFGQALSEAVEMVEIFEVTPDILDPKHPEPSKIEHGRIVFDHVSFAYKDGVSVFKDFSLTVEAGEHVGLVGLSGAGKSTITKLLLRFTDVTKGAITIDGQNITSITQDDLRKSIAYVPQDPVLFHRSLGENIGYGNPNARESEIIEVSKKAHAHEFISALPQGYDTLVGERGVKLSGGERQRVAIARAMLKNVPILMLDEATSSLDTISEKYIQEAFVELTRGKTTIVIAHRLSTIQKMERIIVLNQGRIVEEGSHTKLLRNKGLYWKLWSQQAFY